MIELSKYSSLPIEFSITNTVDTKDTRFLDVTIDVLHTGLNYNGSIFKKEVVEENLDSIKNTPILGYIKMEEGTGNPDDFGAHEYKIVKEDDGTYKYVYAGHSFGVIPESCNARWVTKVSSDGKTREYLEVDGLLWTKFDKAIDIFARDKVKGESMELDEKTLRGIENPDGTFTMTGFKFDGCCILSTTDERIQPAMIDANVTANFSTSIAQEIKEKLNEYQLAINFHNINFSKKESEQSLDKKNEILKKYNLKVEDLDFKIEDISENDFEAKVKEFADKKKDPKPETMFSSTYNEKRQAISNALDPIVERDAEGNLVAETYYYLEDFDDTYCYVEKYYWTNSDSEETYGRFSYTFDETAKTAKLTSDFEQMVVKWLTPAESDQIDQERGDYAKIKTEFETYKKDHETANADVEVLRMYKADKEKAERKAAIDAIFAKAEFESLKDNKEFNDFKTSVGDLKLDDIEEKCYAILGKAQAQGKLNFSVDGKPVTHIKTDMTPEPEDPYGGLFDEFGNKK